MAQQMQTDSGGWRVPTNGMQRTGDPHAREAGVQMCRTSFRLLLQDPPPPGGRGGGCLGPWPAPADPAPHPPTHIRNSLLRQKMKFIKGAGVSRPVLGTQTLFWPLTPPPLLSNSLTSLPPDSTERPPPSH